MGVAGYIGLVILQIGLLSASTTVRSAQASRQNEPKTATPTRTSSAAKNDAQWAADPVRGWVSAETSQEGKEKKPTTKQRLRNQAKPNDRKN
jgi:hypothetical protein